VRGERLAVRPLTPRIHVPVSILWRAAENPTPAARAFREHVLAALTPGAAPTPAAPRRRARAGAP
jgi:DNA-binding transcriptional LysR family regulator